MNRSTIASVIGVVLLATACATGQPAASTSAPTSVPTATATAAGTITVEVATSSFGQHLTASGKALYVLTNDTANTSTCTGGCAGSWPPLTLSGQTTAAGTGVTAQLGTMTRDDGSTQVTANGMPLYYFAADTAAGDVGGQGVGGVWFLAAPDGSALGAAAVDTPTTAPGTPSMPAETDDDYGDYGDGS